MKRFLIGLFLLCLATEAMAATYYVGTSGSDGNSCATAQSSIAGNRKRTIDNALAQCVGAAGSTAGAGNTVSVSAGTYTESLIDKIPSGSSTSAVFTLRCETDFACILSPGGSASAIGINTPTSYVTVRGFKITTGGGVYLSATNPGTHHDIIFEYNEWDGSTMHADGMGVQGSGADRITLRNNYVHDLFGGTGAFTGLAHAFYAADATTNWTITRNHIHDNGAYGIHLYGTGSTEPSGFIISHNRTYNNAAAGIITYGNNHLIHHNITYGNFGGILVRSGSGLLVWNNTVYNNAEGGIYDDYDGPKGMACVNNLAISNGSGNVRNCATATTTNVTTGTAASHFVNAASGDFSLISTSSAIDAGSVSIGTLPPPLNGTFSAPYNGALPDVGAHESLGAVSCVVENATPTKMDCTVQNNVNAPIIPASSITGWTVTGKTISTVDRVGTGNPNTFQITVTVGFSAGTCALSYAQTGNLTDSALIGNSQNQELFAGAATCKNNVGGGAVATVTQSHAAMFTWDGNEGSGPQIGATNSTTALRAMTFGKFLARLGAKTTVADTPATNYAARYSLNAAVYAVLPTFTGAEPVGVCDAPGVSSGNTTQRLTSGSFVAGRVVEVGAGVPTITMTNGQSTELLYPICFGPGLAAGDNIKFRLYKDDGTALAYDTNATLNVDVVSPGLSGL